MSQEPKSPDLLALTRQLVAAFDRGDVDTIADFGADAERLAQEAG